MMCDVEPSVVRSWSLEHDRVVREFSCPVDVVAGSSPDGNRLAFGHSQGNITLVSSSHDHERRSLIGHRGRVSSLAFSPDGKTLASAGPDGSVRLWHVATGQELFVFEDLHRSVLSLAFSGDGRFLAAAGDPFINGNPVAIYDSRPGTK